MKKLGSKHVISMKKLGSKDVAVGSFSLSIQLINNCAGEYSRPDQLTSHFVHFMEHGEGLLS